MSKLAEMMSAAIAEEGADATPVNDAATAVDATLAAADGSAAPDAAAAAKTVAAEQETNGAKPPPEDETEEQKAEREKAEAAAAKPKEQTAAEKATASKFAALAREKSANEDAKAEIRAEKTRLEAEKTHFKAEFDRVNGIVIKERTELAEQRAALDKVLEDPDLLFQHLADHMGIRTVDDLKKLANGAWSKPPKKAPEAPVDPKDKPLTRAELEAEITKRSQEQAQIAENQRTQKEYLALFEDGETYEAAATIWTPEELYAKALPIAKAARESGESYTMADLAAAVNLLATQEARWQRIAKRGQPSTTAAGKPGTGNAAASAATQSTVSSGRPSPQATKALANDTATERATPVNGKPASAASTPAERKAARAARLARLAAS